MCSHDPEEIEFWSRHVNLERLHFLAANLDLVEDHGIYGTPGESTALSKVRCAPRKR